VSIGSDLYNLLKRAIDKRKSQSEGFSRIGYGCEILKGSQFIFPERTVIGSFVHIESGAFLHAQGGININDHAILGPGVVILTSTHRHRGARLVPYDEVDLLCPVTIERAAWIGMRAMILPGVTVAEGSIVGAGAVLTKSFPAGSILGGNPAVLIGQRDMDAYHNCILDNSFYLKTKIEFNLKKIELMR
jgi:acetyltransferase-like isoleucine patch superfamily enzyme